MCGVVGIGPGWDCGWYRPDGPNGLLLNCRDSIRSRWLLMHHIRHVTKLVTFNLGLFLGKFLGAANVGLAVSHLGFVAYTGCY